MIDYKSNLNSQQYEAVTTTEGPLLMLAGAGVGKTHTLTCRVAYLIESGVRPENILLLTFTNKAAKEMVDRIKKLIGDAADDITACTFHSFCAKELRRYASIIGQDPKFEIIDSPDYVEVISMARAELKLDKEKNIPSNKDLANIVSSAINKETTVSKIVGEEYGEYLDSLHLIRNIIRTAELYKASKSMKTYDDILLCFNSSLDKYPFMKKCISNNFHYIMVDEYQDTNIIQDSILFKLRETNNNLCVVGDDSQSLYAFRGANIENILNFRYRIDNCRQVNIMQNYRSNQEILDVANFVINTHATEGFKKRLRSDHHSNKKPIFYRPSDCKTEAKYVYDEILKKREEGIPLSEICVLARGARSLSFLETILTKQKIPYDKYGGIKFLEKAHIKDVLSFIKIISKDNDELSWYRVLQLYPNIGKITARNISRECSRSGLGGLNAKKFQGRVYSAGIRNLYRKITELKGMEDWHDIIREVIDYYSLLLKDNIEHMNTTNEKREEKLKSLTGPVKGDLNILEEMALYYKDLITFLDSILLDDMPNTSDEEDKLILSTIHSAKGLEFNTVFILDCVDGSFPRTYEEDSGSKDDNEELRCFYVAITRAKENLYILSPMSTKQRWGTGEAEISHFISDGLYLLDDLGEEDNEFGMFDRYTA